MNQSYFPGHEKPKKIEVIESGGIKSVVATQPDLSRALGMHINSYIADFIKEGLEGLITQRSGPRERLKLTPRLRAKIMIFGLHSRHQKPPIQSSA